MSVTFFMKGLIHKCCVTTYVIVPYVLIKNQIAKKITRAHVPIRVTTGLLCSSTEGLHLSCAFYKSDSFFVLMRS